MYIFFRKRKPPLIVICYIESFLAFRRILLATLEYLPRSCVLTLHNTITRPDPVAPPLCPTPTQVPVSRDHQCGHVQARAAACAGRGTPDPAPGLGSPDLARSHPHHCRVVTRVGVLHLLDWTMTEI